MIGPTLDAGSASALAWEAVVIGAGPAGALAAQQLAGRGVRVLLIDRAPFPRDKVCGCCLNASALATLDSCGVQIRGIPLSGLDVRCPSASAGIRIRGGQAVSRSTLDATLVQQAIAAGAHFLPGASAVIDAATRQPRIQSGAEQRRLTAKVILAADGLSGTSLRNLREFAPRIARASRIGLGTVLPSSNIPRGRVSMSIAPGAYVGMVRLDPASDREPALDIAAAISPDLLRAFSSPADATVHILRACGTPIPPGLVQAKFKGTPALTRRRPVEDGHIFVLGDAAGYVEPFTGEGIAWALASAAAITTHVLDHLSGRYRVGAWSAAHRRLIGRRQVACQAVAAVLRRPRLTAAAIQLCGVAPRIPERVVERIQRPAGRRAIA